MISRKAAMVWALGVSAAAGTLALAGQAPPAAEQTLPPAAQSKLTAPSPKLNIKLGLWEIKTQPQVNGEMPMSDERLEKMSPDQRARMQAAMQAAMAHMQQPRTMKECMTAEKRAQGFDTGNDDPSRCQQTVGKDTSSDFELSRVCASEQGKTSTDMKFHAVSSDHVVGTVNAVMSRGTKSMTINSTMEGKWLGSDCGSVKDFEMEK
ncbi:MAG TPA: DUF3617 family protein [Steroidobacteraceae bacterium]|jgi:hypothetical protein